MGRNAELRERAPERRPDAVVPASLAPGARSGRGVILHGGAGDGGRNGHGNAECRIMKGSAGATVAHFQRFVSLTANIGRFSHELADLQESMRLLRDMLSTPSPVQLDAALTF